MKISYCQDWLANKMEAANNGIKSDGKKPPRLIPGVMHVKKEPIKFYLLPFWDQDILFVNENHIPKEAQGVLGEASRCATAAPGMV